MRLHGGARTRALPVNAGLVSLRHAVAGRYRRATGLSVGDSGRRAGEPPSRGGDRRRAAVRRAGAGGSAAVHGGGQRRPHHPRHLPVGRAAVVPPPPDDDDGRHLRPPVARNPSIAKAGKPMKNDSYSRGAVILHWILAISIFFLFLSSWWMLGLPLPSDELRFREFPFQLHKNIGLTLVVLLIALLVVRLRRRPAPLTSAAGDSWMNRAAFAGHVLLYVL